MRDIKQTQVLLLKYLRHFEFINHEQIRIACRNLCVSNGIDEKHAILKLLNPLLKMGLVEFCGNGIYKVSPPIIIYYSRSKLAVCINLSDEQKKDVLRFNYKQDAWGVLRFNVNVDDIDIDLEALCGKLNCKYQQYNTTILSQFPKIKDIVYSFDSAIVTSNNLQYYDVQRRKWGYEKKEYSICRLGKESLMYNIYVNDKYYKIPLNKENPEGRLLAESFQSAAQGNNIFAYNKNTKILSVNKINLPILIERVLRLCSMDDVDTDNKDNAIYENTFWKMYFHNVPLEIIKQLNRIFETKTETKTKTKTKTKTEMTNG